MALFDRTITRALPVVPRSVVRRLAAPYIAGATLEDAVRVVQRLNAEGKAATVDVLGEEVATAAEAGEIAAAYHEGLDANISVKLTGLGLELGAETCRANLEALVVDAAARGNFVRIDMEHSAVTDETLQIYRKVRAAGHENVGVVLQAYMRRTHDDVPGLDNVSLCKGISV